MSALGFVLLASTDPKRLREWYRAALDVRTGELADAASAAIVIDGRDDVADRNPEPGRVVLRVEVPDTSTVATRLDALGVEWVPGPADTGGWSATVFDPDGNAVELVGSPPA